MFRCLHSTFQVSLDDLNRLYACNRISALIWNKCLDLNKFYRIITNGKWISEKDLKQLLSYVYPLHSQSVQAVIETYTINRQATLDANRAGYKNKYPWRIKSNFPTTWKQDGFKFKDNCLYLSLAIFNHKRQKPIKIILSKNTLKQLENKQIQEIQLIYKHQLLLSFMYKEKDNNIQKDSNIIVGVDLGEIHSISSITTNNNACIITGRYLRSIRRYQDKNLGKLNHMLSKCQKNSKRYKRLKRTKRKMLIKTNNQIKDTNHKITSKYIKFVKENNVSKVVIGNPQDIGQNTRKNKAKNKGRKHNGRLSKWNYGEHIRLLTYKLNSIGVEVELINESYTSQTCPCCGKRNRCTSRNYKCTCGYICHRDIHGARNILNKSIYGRIYTKGINIKLNRLTYLRPILIL